MDNYLLSFSPLDKESTVSLLRDEEIIGICSEEHFSRVKQQSGFPRQALEYLLRRHSVKPSDIVSVTYPFFDWLMETKLMVEPLPNDIFRTLVCGLPWKYRVLHLLALTRGTYKGISSHYKFQKELLRGLEEYELSGKLVRVHHHLAHAASAYYTAGWDETLIVTIDAYGSGCSGIVAVGRPTGIEILDKVSHINSLGTYYSKITRAFGYTPDRHEGKILGLAAYGKEIKEIKEYISGRFREKGNSFEYLLSHSGDFFVSDLLKQYTKQDVAFAWQSTLEDIVTRYIRKWIKVAKVDRIALAGGVTANVKLNQRIAELPEVREVFVHPGMTDLGTALGSGLYVLSQTKKLRPRQLSNVYFGPNFSDEEIIHSLTNEQLSFEKCHGTIEFRVAQLLADKKIVGRFNGSMEYGPRALGNRSILYHLGDRSVNEWLNRKLRRTETMPFAPATLAEDATKCYKNFEIGKYTSAFMTITFDCTNWMKEHCPAAVHVDGTARPQIVDKNSNLSFFQILREYKRLTGISSVLNTSFNLHEEPIVCSPDDAIRAYKESGLDCLAIGDFLVKKD